MTNPADDDLDLVNRLRGVADALPSPNEARRRAVEIGLSLGLPQAWLEVLPEVDLLPGTYRQRADYDHYGPDAALKWSALEHAVRTGQIADLSRDDLDLIAEALEGEAADDGRALIRDAITDIMFLIAWPKRTYSLHVDLQMAAERIVDGLEGSPSSLLFANAADIARAWCHTTHRVHTLDPDVVLPETSPWPDLADVLRAAAERIAEGNEMEGRRVRGEPVPEMYRDFLDPPRQPAGALDRQAVERPNAERVNDLAKRLMHRLLARRLPHEPDLIVRARDRVRPFDDGSPLPDHVGEWRALLDLSIADLRRRVTGRGEVMDRLRSSSPLLGDGYYADVDLRRRIWRAARRIAVLRERGTLRAHSAERGWENGTIEDR